jgi:hypothetical protein
MHFTVHLRGEKTYEDDFSYGLVFIPSPVWVKGSEHLLNLQYGPELRLGCVARLIEHEGIAGKLTGKKEAIVLVHPIGHGSRADLATLQSELFEQGFTVKIYGEIDNTGPYK